MNFDESETIIALRDSLERFVEREMPRSAAAAWDAGNHFPRDVFKKLADLGVMGLTIPEDYGGFGRDLVATLGVIEELSRRSPPAPPPYILAACYARLNLEGSGTGAQKR